MTNADRGGMVTASFAMTSSSLSQYSVRVMVGGALAVVAILLFAAPLHRRFRYTKKTFFGMVSAVVLSVTIALIATQITLLLRSSSKELSRYNAKIAVFACGEQVPILSDSVLSSTLGNGAYAITPDGEMQLVGYDANAPATLGAFFQAIGGSVSANVATLPFNSRVSKRLTNNLELQQFVKSNALRESYLELRSGDSCSVTPSMLSIYTLRFDATSKSYQSYKIVQHPELYSISNQEYGQRDCVVLTFGDPKDVAKLTCNGYPEVGKISSDTKELRI